MNRLSVLFLCLSICGCGNFKPSPAVQLQPNLTHPARSLSSTPYVEVMGDDQAMAIVANAKNPLWKCSTCVPKQLSTDLIDQVPQVIAKHPDIVVILTGTYDMAAFAAIPCCTDPPMRVPETLSDSILQLLSMYAAAKIPAVICLIPSAPDTDPFHYFDSYYFNEGMMIWNEPPPPPYTVLVPYLFDGTAVGPTEYNSQTGEYVIAQADLTDIDGSLCQYLEAFGLGGTK
jgi:hypothetical protein